MAYKNPKDERAREARRKHYRNNKEQYIKRRDESRIKFREHLKLIKAKPCMDCGVSYPSYVMDLDHRDPKKKSGNINQLIEANNWTAFLQEIDKCDIVCSNCHRERTWNKS